MADEIHPSIEGERRPSKELTNGDVHELSNGEANQSSFDMLNSLTDSDKPDELKGQRELDEEEIPPAEVPVDDTAITPEVNLSEPVETDERVLTPLETPYEHHDEEIVEATPEEASTTTTIESSPEEHQETPAEPIREEEVEESPSLIEPEQSPNDDQEEEEEEEVAPQEDFEYNAADFPPLTSASAEPIIVVEEEEIHLTKKDFPPLPSAPEDILGNKTLLKHTLIAGAPSSRPTRSTLATVSYILSLVDTLTSDVRLIESVTNERFFISESDIIPAIDLSVQFMNRGERALIDSDIRHVYGELGCEEKQIPPVTSTPTPYRMQIELQLHDWSNAPDIQTLSVDERRTWGEKKRLMGNFFFRRRDYANALQCYRGALRFLDLETNPLGMTCADGERLSLIESYIQVQNNVAQVNLFLKKYDGCLHAVENVLRYDPRNVKALFRQGKALFELGKYDDAVQPLKTLTQIQRTNSNAVPDLDKVNEMLGTCEKKLANYQKSEKEIYRRMFQPAPPATTTAANQRRTNQQGEESNSNLWLYVGLGGVALAAVGLFTYMKSRRSA